MKIAYADPPYLGCAQKLYGDPTYDDPQAHHALMENMDAEYDSWALSLHEPSLKVLLPMAPEGARVGVWVKPFCIFKPNVNPAYAWEPVIWKSGRKRSRKEPTVRDWVSCNITLKRGLTGAKPEGFCMWLFELLGARPDDEFHDIFPGTGGVQDAWLKYTTLDDKP